MPSIETAGLPANLWPVSSESINSCVTAFEQCRSGTRYLTAQEQWHTCRFYETRRNQVDGTPGQKRPSAGRSLDGMFFS